MLLLYTVSLILKKEVKSHIFLVTDISDSIYEKYALGNSEIVEKNVSGYIKWFNFKDGYGFVTTKMDKRDIFLHKTGVAASIPENCWPSILIPGKDTNITKLTLCFQS